MNIRLLPLLALALAACTPKKAPETTGTTTAVDPGTSATPAPASEPTPAAATTAEAASTERQVAPDGRLQAIDGNGMPLFDAAGNPIWEPSARERAEQLFKQANALRAGSEQQPSSMQAASDSLRQAVQLDPAFVEAWYNLGWVQLELNLLRDAQDTFKKVTELKADHVAAWAALGVAYEREEAWAPAQIAYERGLAVAPQDVDLLNGRVRMLRSRGQCPEAVTEAKKILAINSNSLDAFNSLGLCYMEQGEFELARFVIVKAQNSVPGGDKSATLEANLGLIFLRMDKEFDAELKFESARKLDPTHAGAAVNLASIKLKNYDFEGARVMLEDARRVLPNNVPIQLNLAVARRGTGDFAGAQALLEPLAVVSGPYQIDAVYNLAILQGDFLKNPQAAFDGFNQYVQLRTDKGDPPPADDSVFAYIKDAKRAVDRANKKKAQSAAAPAPAPAPAPTEAAPAPAETTPAASTEPAPASGGNP